MPNENRVEIIIHADGTAAVRNLDQVGDAHEKAERRIKASSSAISGAWKTMGAAVMAYMTIQKGWEAVQLGAKAAQAEESFRRVAAASKQNADQILADMIRVSAGTVDDSDIMQKAVKGMAFGLQGEQIVKIMEAARISARIAGESVSESYEKIVDAISTNMPRALRHYKLLTQEQAHLIEQANALGIAVDTYTFAMKNAEVQAASFGRIQGNAAEDLQKLKAIYNDIIETIGVMIYKTITLSWWSDPAKQAAGQAERAEQAKKDLDAMTERLRKQIEAEKEKQEILRREKELRQILYELTARGEMIGLEGEELEIAKLLGKQMEETMKMIEARASDLELKLAEAVHTAEQAELRYKFILDREKTGREQVRSFDRAMLDTEEENLRVWIEIGKTMDDYALKTGKITELEAIRRKYQWERAALETQVLFLLQKEPKNAEEAIKLQGDLNNLKEKQVSLGKYEVAETDIQKIANLREMLALQREGLGLQIQQYEYYWKQMMNTANQVGGEAGKGLGLFGAGLKSNTDIAAQQDPYSQQFDRAVEHYSNMYELYRNEKISEDQLDEETRKLYLARDQMDMQQRAALWTGGFQAMSGLMLAFYSLSGGKHREFFELYKTFAIAEAMVNTYKAAIAAYAAMVGIPYVGPALAVVAAAAAVAFGIAQVVSIGAMQPGGGMATAATPAGGGGYAYDQPTTPTWQPAPAERPRSLTVTVHVYGSLMGSTPDEISRSLLPYIRKAEGDGV